MILTNRFLLYIYIYINARIDVRRDDNHRVIIVRNIESPTWKRLKLFGNEKYKYGSLTINLLVMVKISDQRYVR